MQSEEEDKRFRKHCDHRSRAEFHHVKERRPEDGEARGEGLDDRGEDYQIVDFEREAREEVGRNVSYKYVCPRRVIRCKSKIFNSIR